MIKEVYHPQTLQKLVDIINRQNINAAVDRSSLQGQLGDLLVATGRIVDDTDKASLAFRAAVADQPRHKTLTKIYRRLSRSTDPLNPEWFNGMIAAEMERQAELIWGSSGQGKANLLIGKTTDQFSTQQLVEIRQMAAKLAQYHSGEAPPGSRQKLTQNTMLMHLAEIFLRAAALADLDRFDLPHSTRSYFIQFAHVALEPFFPKTEVSAEALSKRWKRLIEARTTS